MSERKKRTTTVERRPALNLRTSAALRARIEAAARDHNASLSHEVIARLEASFASAEREDFRAGMTTFWAWFDGVMDAVPCSPEDQRLLGLVRRRLEVATGIRSEPVAPVALKVVESA